MKYYIVHYDPCGYYVGWKSKNEDEYNQSYILAKKYKTLGPVLTNIGIDYSDYHSLAAIRKIDLKIPLYKGKEESIKSIRKRKLNKLSNPDLEVNYNILYGAKIEAIEIDGNQIKKLGVVSDKEIYDFIKKYSDKYQAKKNTELNKMSKYLTDRDKELLNSEVRNSTQEEIDAFCE
jgi:flagellin-like hook-associated protein FlgL